MTEFEKMRNGLLYNGTDWEIIKKHLRTFVLCEKYNKTSFIRIHRRQRLLKKIIPNSTDNALVFSPFKVEYGENISLGDYFFSNFNCIMLDVAKITIGDNAMLGPNVTLATPMHPLCHEERIVQDYPVGKIDLEYAKPITIGNNVWIASNVTIVGGVTIGDNVVIGAGSLVLNDIPSGVLAAGSPAKVIKKITEEDKLDVWQTYLDEKPPISKRDAKHLS